MSIWMGEKIKDLDVIVKNQKNMILAILIHSLWKWGWHKNFQGAKINSYPHSPKSLECYGKHCQQNFRAAIMAEFKHTVSHALSSLLT